LGLYNLILDLLSFFGGDMTESVLKLLTENLFILAWDVSSMFRESTKSVSIFLFLFSTFIVLPSSFLDVYSCLLESVISFVIKDLVLMTLFSCNSIDGFVILIAYVDLGIINSFLIIRFPLVSLFNFDNLVFTGLFFFYLDFFSV